MYHDLTETPAICRCDQTAEPPYTKAGETCVKQSDVDAIIFSYPIVAARLVDYYSSEGKLVHTVSNSQVMNQNFIRTAFDCQTAKSPLACSNLANLCVLTNYNEKHETCKLFKAVNAGMETQFGSIDPGYKVGMPWLFYERPANSILADPLYKLDVSFNEDEEGASLNFVIMTYNLAGKLQSIRPFAGQLQLCSMLDEDLEKITGVGINYKKHCKLDLGMYVNKH